MSKQYPRRKFLADAAKTGVAISCIDAPVHLFASEKTSMVNIGLIAVGARGQLHLSEMCKRKDVKVVAIADPDKEMIAAANKIVARYGKELPVAYAKGPYDYRNLLKRDDIDAVIVSSPWEWHLPHGIDAMNSGKIVGMEVGSALKLQDCWDFVDTYEKKKVPIMILENVCYRRDIMAVLNMVRKGMFGELLHFQGGYQHDMRKGMFNDGKTRDTEGMEFGDKAVGKAKWRTPYYLHRNGDLYPTHGLGPGGILLNINRGNLMTGLTSIATKAKGLHRFIMNHPKGGAGHPNAKINFKLGDIINTQIQCANGETILLTHDTTSPRPYNLGFRVQGTNGLWQESGSGEFKNGLMYLENRTAGHSWENPEKNLQEFDHPLWKKFEKDAESSGHGGMDFLVDNAFIECIKRESPFPLDVYDLASWYAITPLSEQSIAEGGQLVKIPDFTRGKWKSRQPLFEMED